jgi:hypothetical protein
VRIGTAHRIAEEKDQLHIREQFAYPSRDARVEHVVGAGLVAKPRSIAQWKVHAIPVLATIERIIKVMHFLGVRWRALRMTAEVIKERGGASLLRTSDNASREWTVC